MNEQLGCITVDGQQRSLLRCCAVRNRIIALALVLFRPPIPFRLKEWNLGSMIEGVFLYKVFRMDFLGMAQMARSICKHAGQLAVRVLIF